MVNIRHDPKLTIHERALLTAVALIITRLEQTYPTAVAFVSGAQYYITYADIAEALQGLTKVGIQSAGT